MLCKRRVFAVTVGGDTFVIVSYLTGKR